VHDITVSGLMPCVRNRPQFGGIETPEKHGNTPMTKCGQPTHHQLAWATDETLPAASRRNCSAQTGPFGDHLIVTIVIL